MAEAAYRELNSPGSLAQDLERGGAIQSLQAGSVEIVYSSTAPSGMTFTQIEAILSGLIGPVGGSCYTAMAVIKENPMPNSTKESPPKRAFCLITNAGDASLGASHDDPSHIRHKTADRRRSDG